MLIMWTQRTRILHPKKNLKIMVIWLQMVGIMVILGLIHMGEQIIAPMLQGETKHLIWKMNTISKMRKMSTSKILHL